MKKTKIEWCDSTVNPTQGCRGCELWGTGVRICYAGRTHTRWEGAKAYPLPFGQPTINPGKMTVAAKWSDLTGKPRTDKPWLDGLPRIIFVSDMSDALSIGISDEYLSEEVRDVVASPNGKRHVWIWLTKRPRRMMEMPSRWGFRWPKNLVAGVSVTDQETANVRIRRLVQMPIAARIVSAEPLHGPIVIERKDLAKLHWVVAGAETGQGARWCDPAWGVSLAQQCAKVGVPFFWKKSSDGSRMLGDRMWNDVPRDSFQRLVGRME